MPNTMLNFPNQDTSYAFGYMKKLITNIKQVDLSINFFKKCINSKYIMKNYPDYCASLNEYDMSIVKHADEYIKQMKVNNFNESNIIEANKKVFHFLNIYFNYYGLSWNKREIVINKKIFSLEDVLQYSFSSESSIFDTIFNDNLIKNDKDIIILNIEHSFQLPFAIRFSKMLKSSNKNISIIFFGKYITQIKENLCFLLQKAKVIDGIILYNDFDSLYKLTKYFLKRENYKIYNSLIFFDGKVINNSEKSLDLKNIEQYLPDFEGINMEDYLSNKKIIALNFNYGCYYSKCNFCSRKACYTNYYRLNIQKIFLKIKELYLLNKIECINIVDECVPVDVLILFSDFLINNNIHILWMVETRIDSRFSDYKIAHKMYQSGCREISFGIESYNQRILNVMKKGINLSEIDNALKNFHTEKISVSGTFIIGYPTESIFETIKTLIYIKHSKYIDTFGISQFYFIRNSDLTKNIIYSNSDLRIIYSVNDVHFYFSKVLLTLFNYNKKIKKFVRIREAIMFRTEYMYLNRNLYSLNRNGI